jgi:Domain of unknown function (DUF4158)
MGEREIARYYTLSDKDLQIIRRHRRDHNRLGFSIQLCHLRFPGWPLKPGTAPSPQLLAYVARQLNVSPELVHDYSRDRDTTRREHLLELQRDFGFQPFTEGLSSKLADLLLPDALRSPKPMPLITALLESRIAITEAEVAEMKEGMAGKRELLRSWRKPLSASTRSGPLRRSAALGINGRPRNHPPRTYSKLGGALA